MLPQIFGRLQVILIALSLERVYAIGPGVGASAMLFAATTHPNWFQNLVVGSGATDAALAGRPLKA